MHQGRQVQDGDPSLEPVEWGQTRGGMKQGRIGWTALGMLPLHACATQAVQEHAAPAGKRPRTLACLYVGSSLDWGGARNTPPGLYTKSSASPLPGCP